MEPLRYRDPLPAFHGVADCPHAFGILPIPFAVVEQAHRLEADLRQHAPGDGPSCAHMCSILSHALVDPLPPYARIGSMKSLMKLLSPERALKLYRDWESIQLADVPDLKQLKRAVVRGWSEHVQYQIDGGIGYASGLLAIYGVPSASELTIGQVGYAMAVSSAYADQEDIKSNGMTRAVVK